MIALDLKGDISQSFQKKQNKNKNNKNIIWV